MAYVVMAYAVMAYVVMTDVVMAYVVMAVMDNSGDKLISFHEFMRFDLLLNKPDAAPEIAFELTDRDHNGVVSLAEMTQTWIRFAGLPLVDYNS